MRPGIRTYTKMYHDFMGPFGAQRLSTPAQSLLIALLCQFDGFNNGALKITASVLPARWRSSDLRQRARRELLENRFIFELARGYRPNRASLYALACFPIDPNPQHEPELVAAFDESAWRVVNDVPSGGTNLHRDTAQMAPKPYAAQRHNADPAMPSCGIVVASIVPPQGTKVSTPLCRRTATYKTSSRLPWRYGSRRSS